MGIMSLADVVGCVSWAFGRCERCWTTSVFPCRTSSGASASTRKPSPRLATSLLWSPASRQRGSGGEASRTSGSPGAIRATPSTSRSPQTTAPPSTLFTRRPSRRAGATTAAPGSIRRRGHASCHPTGGGTSVEFTYRLSYRNVRPRQGLRRHAGRRQRGPRRAHGRRVRPTGTERSGQDHGHPDARHLAAARLRRGAGAWPQRRRRGRCGARSGEPHRAIRLRRRGPHRTREPRPDRPAARLPAKARADELLDAFGLAEAAAPQVNKYSGGMRRRLDFAASIVVTPDLLFLDEPTTGLDPTSDRDPALPFMEARREA